MRKSALWIIASMLLMFACNMPGIAGSGTGETPTPAVYVTVLVATPTPDAEADATSPSLTTTPNTTGTPNVTATLSATLTPTGTLTVTPTATATGPTATPTLAPMGDPLGFGDPPWELMKWHELTGTDNWEGIIRVHAVGGVPPYRYQIEDKPVSESLDLLVQWRLCKPMPATVRIWSADGQVAHTSIWVWELGCKD